MIMARYLAILLYFTVVASQRNTNLLKDRGHDVREIQRQNRITQQIITNYLERKLFPNRRPQHQAPSVDEIIQIPGISEETKTLLIAKGGKDKDDDTDPETLQSVGSENIDNILDTPSNTYRDCLNCVDDSHVPPNRWTMPLTKIGDKRYYLGIFFKANWFRASQYCRYHGMHLASISSQEENDRLEKYIKDYGYGNEHFWTSGTDLADEGNFFWMATGRPITFTNWNAGEPNNFRYENGEEENCLELWNRDGKGLKWNDSPCSFETYFVCEVQ